MAQKSELLLGIEARTAMSGPPDTRNGAIIHPEAIANYGESLTSGDGTAPAYAASREALKVMAETLSKVRAADESVRTPNAQSKKELVPGSNDTRWPIDPNHVERFTAALADSYKRADTVFTKSLETVTNTIAALSTQMGAILTDAKKDTASRALQSESVRAHVRSLPAPERMMLLGTLARDGRHAAVSAVLDADPICSGLTADEHSKLRTVAEQAFSPALFAKRESARAVAAHLGKAGRDFIQRFETFRPRANAVSTEKVTTALDDLAGKIKIKANAR